MQPKFSFIIPSINRDKELQRCISSIEEAHFYRQDIQIEILVVIQNTLRGKNIQTRYPGVTSVYYIDKKGLSLARNFAIAKSTGDYFIFIDDDASVSEDFIDVLLKEITSNNTFHAFCGKIMDPTKIIPFSKLFYNNDMKKLGWFDYQYFMGSAHILSRQVLERIGIYDEEFGAGAKYYGSEETDIFFRLKAAGEKVLYLPNLIFFHPIPNPPVRYVFDCSYAIGAVLTKQLLSDKVRSVIYLFIILSILSKSLFRILQSIFIFWSIMAQDVYHCHRSVFTGTLKGIYCYLTDKGLNDV